MAGPTRRSRVESIHRQLLAKLGRRGRGKFAAIDPKRGTYVLADDLDGLVRALLDEYPASRRRDLRILRLGHRAAIELRIVR